MTGWFVWQVASALNPLIWYGALLYALVWSEWTGYNKLREEAMFNATGIDKRFMHEWKYLTRWDHVGIRSEIGHFDCLGNCLLNTVYGRERFFGSLIAHVCDSVWEADSNWISRILSADMPKDTRRTILIVRPAWKVLMHSAHGSNSWTAIRKKLGADDRRKLFSRRSKIFREFSTVTIWTIIDAFGFYKEKKNFS